MIRLEVSIADQTMRVFDADKLMQEYQISTAKNGTGEQSGSEKTPRGMHIIRAKIGENCPPNTVFIRRRPTGEIYSPALREQFPDRDWILTRILWLSGREPGKNRFGEVDTMRRYIYIHGTPDDVQMGVPGSRGCIRMRNKDITDLFLITPIGAQIEIK
jgi:L,D-transpeptidase YbiS